jgi:hypothetical protein
VFVGDGLLEVSDRLSPALRIALVSQLAAMCTELIPQSAIFGR